MSNRLKRIVSIIQAITDKTQEELAKSINYSREHLNANIKKGHNLEIENLLREKYRLEIEEYFNEVTSLMQQDQTGYEEDSKLIDVDKQLMHDTIQVKAMLRVIMRNQAVILAAHTGAKASVILKEMTKAVRAETSDEFEEL